MIRFNGHGSKVTLACAVAGIAMMAFSPTAARADKDDSHQNRGNHYGWSQPGNPHRVIHQWQVPGSWYSQHKRIPLQERYLHQRDSDGNRDVRRYHNSNNDGDARRYHNSNHDRNARRYHSADRDHDGRRYHNANHDRNTQHHRDPDHDGDNDRVVHHWNR